jgi:hypothetical protein
VAFDALDAEIWRHPFEPGIRAIPADTERHAATEALHDEGTVLAATSYFQRNADDSVQSGRLISLTAAGSVQRTFAPEDRPVFAAGLYDGPWAITDYRTTGQGGSRRVAVAAHHYAWWPSIITVLDDQMRKQGTFIHPGWLERVHWLTADRLLAAGYSNAFEGGVVALLDADALDGQPPYQTGSTYECRSCGPGRPLQYVVMPRSEVNRASASRFNRARLQLHGDRIIVRTIEVPQAEGDAADAIYTFSAGLDLLKAEFSLRYWEVHRKLERDGTLDHPRERCPDRDGPRAVLRWDPAEGWRTVSRPPTPDS